jgi:hypothetical protein
LKRSGPAILSDQGSCFRVGWELRHRLGAVDALAGDAAEGSVNEYSHICTLLSVRLDPGKTRRGQVRRQ